jgi:transcriptional regulator with XRE-family HTH domain
MAQGDVAQYLGVSRTAVTHWESGKKRPDLVNLVKLADLYNVSLDYLMGRTDNPAPVTA